MRILLFSAHVAQVHSRHLKGAANKQARTLDIEFTLAPRPRQERIYHRQNYIDRYLSIYKQTLLGPRL